MIYETNFSVIRRFSFLMSSSRKEWWSEKKKAMIRWTSKAVKIWKKCEISDSWKCRLSRRRASASDYRMSRHNRDRQAGHLTTYSSDVDTGRGSRPHGTATFCRRPCVIRVNRPTYIEDISNSIIFFFLFCINIFKKILRKKKCIE